MFLSVRTINTPDGTALKFWEMAGQHPRFVRAPFNPFYYSYVPLSAGIESERVTKTLLSTLKPKEISKIGFLTTNHLANARTSTTFEDHIKFVDRVAVDMGYKFKSPLPKHDAFDIEVRTKGNFPRRDDPISAISYFGKSVAECDIDEQIPEYEIIARFGEKPQKNNDDLVDSYFGSKFDWPKIVERAGIVGVDLPVGRDGRPPYIATKTQQYGKKIGEYKTVYIEGRWHFDVYDEVRMDQSLFGIKNRKLKTVAKWFGMPVIEVDRSRISELSGQELFDYCLSDARATWNLAEIYLRNMQWLAEYLEITLNMVIQRTPSMISRLVYMREYSKLGIVSDKPNYERYPEFFVEGRKAYQGATVRLFKPGIHFDLKNVDFKSMYPVAIGVHNWSPETLLQCDIIANLKPAWLAKYDGEWIYVYDDKIGVIKTRTDLSKDSVSRTLLLDWMQQRKKIRKAPETETLESQQWGLKVLMNSLTGYHGLKWAGYGAVPIIAQVTGVGRYWLNNACRFYDRKPDTENIETDTDGIYITGEPYLSEINDFIKSLVPDQYRSDLIRIEKKKYDAGIFYDEKGYVLLRNGKLLFHGSGLKGRHLPNVCDKALERVTWAIFQTERIPSILREIGSELKNNQFSDFIMNMQLSKDPGDYNAKTMHAHLIAKMRKANIPVSWGDDVQFVKTKWKGLQPVELVKKRDLDLDYYRRRIAAVVQRLLQVAYPTVTAKDVVTVLKGGKMYETRKFA